MSRLTNHTHTLTHTHTHTYVLTVVWARRRSLWLSEDEIFGTKEDRQQEKPRGMRGDIQKRGTSQSEISSRCEGECLARQKPYYTCGICRT